MIMIFHIWTRLVIIFLSSLWMITFGDSNLFAQKTGITEKIFSDSEESLQFTRYGTLDKKIRWISNQKRVLSQLEINHWAYAQGLDISPNSDLYGINNHNGLIFFPPGIGFSLYSRNPEVQTGWILSLDIGVLKEKDPYKEEKEKLSTSYSYMKKSTSMEIFIDGIFYKKIELGYGNQILSPVHIPIPYIRSLDGRIDVDLKLVNYADNFAILYDAVLRR